MTRVAKTITATRSAAACLAVLGSIALALLAAASASFVAFGGTQTGSPDEDAAAFRVMTLNMAHGRAMARTQAGMPRGIIERNLDQMAQLIRDVAPDVVALQEADGPSTWSGGFSHVDYVAARAPMPGICHGRHMDLRLFPVCIQYGTALLANEKLSGCRSRAFGQGRRDTKGFVTASIQIDGRSVSLVSIHLDHRSARRRTIQAKQLVDYVQGRSGPVNPIVVMGDFNTDGSGADALRFVCDALDLRQFVPDARSAAVATYPANQPVERIDWILISDRLRFIRYEVRDDVVSDHRAVWADIGWR